MLPKQLRHAMSLAVLLTSTAVAQETPSITVLRHVTVVDVAHGTLLADRAVEIRGDRIAAVTPATGYKAPDGARVLDLPGRYLVPGFVEMHAHVLAHPWDAEGNLKPRYDREATLAMLRLMLAHGITTVRDPGSETETAVTLRKMLAEGKVTGPSLLTAGRILNSSDFDPEPFAVVKDEAAVRNEIRWQAVAGVDFIKVYSSMRPAWRRRTAPRLWGRKNRSEPSGLECGRIWWFCGPIRWRRSGILARSRW